MGQQQLLLLVLSTVIVGLATVAGIQAFSENQAQATQDALIMRATETASDILAAHNKPSQMGGVNITNVSDASGATNLANAIGLSSSTFDADGAGEGATCDINSGSGDGTFNNSPEVHVECSSGDGAVVEVGIDPDASGSNDKIETAITSAASV